MHVPSNLKMLNDRLAEEGTAMARMRAYSEAFWEEPSENSLMKFYRRVCCCLFLNAGPTNDGS
jgi:hypothetical protein